MLRCAQHDSDVVCHPEPCRERQRRSSEGSLAMGTEMLPLRFAQGFGSRAQHDSFALRMRGPTQESLDYLPKRRSRRELLTTVTDENAIAAAAKIGA